MNKATRRLVSSRCVLTLCIVMGLSLPGCKQEPVIDTSPDYAEYLKNTARSMCGHLLYCFEPFTRALSPVMQKQVTVEHCMQSALKDLDQKVKRLDPALQQLSRECYTALLKAPCNEFGLVAYWNFSCIRVRAEVDRMLFQAR